MYGRARLRLTLWYMASSLLVLLLLGAGTYFGLVWALDRELDASIRAVVDDWSATAPPVASLQPLDLEAHVEGAPSDVFLVVFRADGALVANPRGVEAEDLVDNGVVRSALAGHEVWGTVSIEHARLRVRGAPLIEDGRVAGVVIGGRNLAGRDESVRTLVFVLGLVAGAGLVAATAAGYVLAGRALSPLRQAHERQRAFVGDASHELRSPLTLIRALAEVLERDPDLPAGAHATARDLVTATDEASALVGDLLALARMSDAPARAEDMDVTDLAEAARAALDQVRPGLEEHGSEVTQRLEMAPAAIPTAEAARLVRALLENVRAHTPPGTPVRLSTTRTARDSTLTVEDAGPGVPEPDLERIFERFTQLDPARTRGRGGTAGLGLAIVRAITERRGGRAVAERSPLGGLRVTVSLPASARRVR